MQAEMAETANQVFRQLDRRRPEVRHGARTKKASGRTEQRHVLSRSCTRPSAACRKAAFHQYYAQFKGHENTLAAALAGSMQRDVYYAKARNYPSALGGALFPDNVPAAVYDNLIAAVHKQLAGAVSLLTICGGAR